MNGSSTALSSVNKRLLRPIKASVLDGSQISRLAAVVVVVVYGFLVLQANSAIHSPGSLGFNIGACEGSPCVTSVMPATVAWFDGIRPQMPILSIDGRPMDSYPAGAEPMEPVESATVETSPGQSVDVAHEPASLSDPATRTSIWLLGAVFALLGAAVLIRRPDLHSARMFGFFAGASAIALAVAPASEGPQLDWALGLSAFSLIGVGAACFPFVFALVTESPRRKRVSGSFIAIGLGLAVGYSLSVFSDPGFYSVVRPAVLLFVAASLFGSIAFLAISARRPKSETGRLQTRIALWGIALGTVPITLRTFVPQAFGIGGTVTDPVTMLTIGIVPTAFAYSILQHQMLGIRRLVHRGMVYVIASVALVAIISVVLAGAQSLLEDESGFGFSISMATGLLALGVLLFFPLRSGAIWLVDRFLYTDTVTYENIIEAVRGDLLTSNEASGTIAEIMNRLVDGVGLESALLFLGNNVEDAKLEVSVGPRAQEMTAIVQPQLRPRILASADSDMADLRWEADSILLTMLRTSGRNLGYMLLGPKNGGDVFVDDERRLVAAMAPLLALTVDQSLLTSELRDLNQKLVKAQEDERGRFAVDIHDGPLQKAIILSNDRPTPAMGDKELARDLVSELREISSRLRPSILDDLGLPAALDWLLQGASRWSDFEANLALDGLSEDERFAADSEQVLFRVTQEALNNAAKHAQASSVTVTLAKENGNLAVQIDDDGVGFTSTRSKDGGFGLPGMRERVLYLRGDFQIESVPGVGTTVRAKIPIDTRIN